MKNELNQGRKMMFNSIKFATVIGATLIAGAAMAQDYPEKPIEVIVGYSAGGAPT